MRSARMESSGVLGAHAAMDFRGAAVSRTAATPSEPVVVRIGAVFAPLMQRKVGKE
jgi:hypothetical protein